MSEVASQSLQSESESWLSFRSRVFHRELRVISNKIEPMSLLIAFVLLLSLCWGEFCAVAVSEPWQTIAIKVALLTLLAPIFAAIQIVVSKRRHSKANQWFPRFRMMAIAHTIVWAVASATIAIWLQWSAVVQLIPFSTSTPLADDLLIVAPAMLSLVGSWAIFIFAAPKGSLAKSKSRTGIFALWLRMQVAIVAAPILFAFFVTDCMRLATAAELSPQLQVLFWCLCGALVFASILFYPQVMLFVWSTRRIEDKPFEARCEKLFQLGGIRKRKVRVWKTGNSIVNAAAVGIVPGTEVIVVSDMLLDKFNDKEVDAILLHEIGHIRHRHCIKRIAMVLVPLTLLAIDQATGLGLHRFIADNNLLTGIFGSLTQFFPAIAFIGYLLVVSRTLFRNMEFEADRFAIQSLSHTNEHCAVQSALEKMAIIYPRQLDRRSGLHPSIRQRLAFVLDLRAKILGETGAIGSAVPAPKSISLDPVAAK